MDIKIYTFWYHGKLECCCTNSRCGMDCEELEFTLSKVSIDKLISERSEINNKKC